MRFNPLLAAVAGIVVIGSIPALVKDDAHSGRERHEVQRPPGNTSLRATAASAASAPTETRRAYCPGTNQTDFDCNAVSAIANIRQADAADRFNRLALFEISVGLATAIAAIAAAFFAAGAARAARDTVRAFTDVERADIVVTLENFRYTNVTADFDVVANNLGRSAALIFSVGVRWVNSNDIENVKGFGVDIKPRIVPAAGNVTLHESKRMVTQLRSEPFIWLLVKTRSPLRGYITQRYCFRVLTQKAVPHGTCYTDEYSDEIDNNDFHRTISFDADTGLRRRRWWEVWRR